MAVSGILGVSVSANGQELATDMGAFGGMLEDAWKKGNEVWEEKSSQAAELWEEKSSQAAELWDSGTQKAQELWGQGTEKAKQLLSEGSDLAVQLWYEGSEFVSQQWDEHSAEVVDAWNQSVSYVMDKWENRSEWAAYDWDNFTMWAKTIIDGNPYEWINYTMMADGVIAYEEWEDLRAFLEEEPDLEQIHERYDQIFDDISLAELDKRRLWQVLEDWSSENGMALEDTARLCLPFAQRLEIEGGSAIGSDVVLSGPTVGSYFITLLGAMDLKKDKDVQLAHKMMDQTLAVVQEATVVREEEDSDHVDRVDQAKDKHPEIMQMMYYSDAVRGIRACFQDGQYQYLDKDGEPVAIEVPFDQYEQALQYMKNRISNGEVPGVFPSDQEMALEIVKQGELTYQQVKHIAKAETVEGISFDPVNNCIICESGLGITATVIYALNIWNGESDEDAMEESVISGIRTGGSEFVMHTFSADRSLNELDEKELTSLAVKGAARVLRGTGAIGNTVALAVCSAEDISDIVQGKISWKQLAKNMSKTAAGFAGSTVGYMSGAAIGSVILPGIGTITGLILGVAAGWGASEGMGNLVDFLAEDDAEEMIALIEAQFTEIGQEYFLDAIELEEAFSNLQELLSADMLKEMYQYEDHAGFARVLIEMSMDPVVCERKYVDLPDEKNYWDLLEEFCLGFREK